MSIDPVIENDLDKSSTLEITSSPESRQPKLHSRCLKLINSCIELNIMTILNRARLFFYYHDFTRAGELLENAFCLADKLQDVNLFQKCQQLRKTIDSTLALKRQSVSYQSSKGAPSEVSSTQKSELYLKLMNEAKEYENLPVQKHFMGIDEFLHKIHDWSDGYFEGNDRPDTISR